MPVSNLYIVNSLGVREPFSEKKVFNALKRSGASNQVANNILVKVKDNFIPEMTTFELFKMVRAFLKKEELQTSIKFNLRESMRLLGPAGFIFEKYIADVFGECGYKVKIDQIIKGRCVDYEMDVLAKKEGVMYLTECKYRNRQGEKVDVNVCLKEFALLNDVRRGKQFSGDTSISSIQSLIVTNTKFTEQAIKYAECEGIYLFGWRYPTDGGLEKIIEDRNLYPITILPSFKNHLMDYFAGKGMMLAKDVLAIKDIAKFSEIAKIPERQIEALYKEAKALLENK
ncbi:MAG: restriction endonuclease [Candidatus Pacebacteria bacterium]|nr:restriction endonuclease [Candidatus Paceibacterota bacterium]